MKITSKDLITIFFNGFKNKGKCHVGASSIMNYKDNLIFSITKTKKWYTKNGSLHIPYSGIGGSLEGNETILDTIIREVKEEVGLNNNQYIIKNSKKTLFIDKINNIFQYMFITDLNIKPDCILQLKVNNGNSYSYLLLFIYNIDVVIHDIERYLFNSENSIPGYIFIPKNNINNILSKNYLHSDDLEDLGLLIKNRDFFDTNKAFILEKQFTPIAIMEYFNYKKLNKII